LGCGDGSLAECDSELSGGSGDALGESLGGIIRDLSLDHDYINYLLLPGTEEAT